MAKLIKKNDTGAHKAVAVASDYEPVSASRVISRSTNEARADSVRIRERTLLEKDEIIKEAKEQAKQIADNATADIEKRKENAHAEGFEEGKAAAAAKWTEAIAQSENQAKQLEAQLVPQLKSIAITIARKILGEELKTHPDQVISLIKQALMEKARNRQEVLLKVHPADLERVRGSKATLLEVLSHCKDITIREDEGVSEHGVIIETDAGKIDAQLETQLAIFEKVLLAQK